MLKIAHICGLVLIWHAKPILYLNFIDQVAKLVEQVMALGADPNATAAGKDALPGTVPGSTPSVFLAATRGYYKVIEVFKKNSNTNFLLENKFKQTILHMVLKAGYYNKIVVHGEESGEVNILALRAFFSDNNLRVQQQMRSIVNRQDDYGNTPLHYAKTYPDQSIVILLLENGAKIDKNPQGTINVNSKTLEQYFFENCITPEGDDIDDEDFRIKVNYRLFEKPLINEKMELVKTKEKAEAWVLEMEKSDAEKGKGGKGGKGKPKSSSPSMRSGKVDTKRLEIFSDSESMHYLLKHPVMASFLEMELNSLKIRYLIDFLFYLLFVIILFFFLSDLYDLSEKASSVASASGTTVAVMEIAKEGKNTYIYKISVWMIILIILLVFLFIREFYQIYKLRPRRYFTEWENYLEWAVIVLVILNLLPWYWMKKMGADDHLQRHLAALTLLLAFIQLYLLLVRLVPNTPLPVYVNMFTTVLRTYVLILASYFFFILTFAYCFFLILSQQESGVVTEATTTTTTAAPAPVPGPAPAPAPGPAPAPAPAASPAAAPATTTAAPAAAINEPFETVALSLVKTIVMFAGEMDYTDIVFHHWMGYLIWVLFVFLVVIVLMNILNGLAVSDIGKIQEEVDKYYNISVVESLAHSSFVSLLAEEIVIYPNIRPENQKFLGISMPGKKVQTFNNNQLN